MAIPAPQPDTGCGPGGSSFATMARAADRERVLVQLVSSVWDSILGMAILARDDAEHLDDPSRQVPLLTGSVRISGTWEGRVVMCVPFSLARECGAHMHGRVAAALTDDDVRDAWGELVNVVGGNLKALLPSPSQLALPEVHEATTWASSEPESISLNTIIFACLGERMRLSLLKQPA
jgi:chemotaxis protein CheX